MVVFGPGHGGGGLGVGSGKAFSKGMFGWRVKIEGDFSWMSFMCNFSHEIHP